jgi:5-methylcytosine-specific restriction endonuclease McrA
MQTIRALDDQTLLSRFGAEVARDFRRTALMLRLIDEIDRRMLWASRGHSSMFAFCVGRFRMSESMAGKRIGVARLGRRFPVIFEMVAVGELHPSGALCLKPHLDEDNHRRVLDRARGKSRREIEKLVAELFPRPDVASSVRALPLPRKESSKRVEAQPPLDAADGTSTRAPADAAVRAPSPPPKPLRAPDPEPLAPRRYKLTVTIDEEAHGELERLQDLLAHQIPDGDPAAIVKKALGVLLAETLKKKAALTDRPKTAKRRTKKRVRAIPAAIRRAVWERDEGRCTFVGDDGKVCGETRGLEFAHLDPWAKGGEHSVETMALRCRGHNGYEAVRDYGAELIERKRRERSGVRETVAAYGPEPLRERAARAPRARGLSPGKASGQASPTAGTEAWR